MSVITSVANGYVLLPGKHNSLSSRLSLKSSISSLCFKHLHESVRGSKMSSLWREKCGPFIIKGYIEKPNSAGTFVNKVIGSLPIVGLLARIFSDEGGIGDDLIDFAEFRRRVGKKCSINDSRAFYEFRDRRGKSGDPLYVLLCCWLAAIGAGLVKSEELLEGVARLRLSNDIEFEEETFLAIMKDAKERRSRLKQDSPTIPVEVRVDKALEAIYVCCFGRDPIEEEDKRLLKVIVNAVFPSIGQSAIEEIVNAKAEQIAKGEIQFPQQQNPLPKEAVLSQMKDLEFLKQNRES